MLDRILEAEAMDTPAEASDYDGMDHSAVNRKFAADFLSLASSDSGLTLDVGTGTAQIPIELCRQSSAIRIVAVDLADEMLKLARSNVERAAFAFKDIAKGFGHLGPGARDAVFGPHPDDCIANTHLARAPHRQAWPAIERREQVEPRRHVAPVLRESTAIRHR